MKKITIILILSFNFSCTDVNSLIDELAKVEMMESEYIGFTGMKSKQYQKFQKLKSKTSDNELRKLVKHKNPILRTYAYQSLIERKLIKPSEAFGITLLNNESFSEMSADMIMSTDICTQIYFETVNFYINPESEIRQMDSLILFNLDEDHFLHYMALKDKKYEGKYNERITNLALDYHNASAIFYIVENKIDIDKSKLKESIKTVIKKGEIGAGPIKELNEILINLNDEISK